MAGMRAAQDASRSRGGRQLGMHARQEVMPDMRGHGAVTVTKTWKSRGGWGVARLQTGGRHMRAWLLRCSGGGA